MWLFRSLNISFFHFLMWKTYIFTLNSTCYCGKLNLFTLTSAWSCENWALGNDRKLQKNTLQGEKPQNTFKCHKTCKIATTKTLNFTKKNIVADFYFWVILHQLKSFEATKAIKPVLSEIWLEKNHKNIQYFFVL